MTTTLLSALDLHLDTVDGPLFRNLNLNLRLGDRVGLMGHNGCGKSTLLALLAGDLSPDRGQIQRAHHCHLQRVEQYLPAHLTQRSCWDVLVDALPEPDAHWLAEQQLARLGLQEQRNVPASDLSGGQHTRLLLGRALLQEPNLLLLDEPSNHLDLEGKDALAEQLNHFTGALLLVSHDRALIEASCNRFWLIQQGKLVEWSSAEQAWAQLAQHSVINPAAHAATASSPAREEEALLQALLDLEARLEADLARKPRQQKPQLQQAWRTEIARLQQLLGLV